MNFINSREEILAHHKQFFNFVHELSKLDEHVLRQPMQESKWSIIEVIGHFQPWDQFVIEKRLPYIFKNEEIPASPKVEEVNANAALRARNNPIHVTIEHFMTTRTQLIDLLSDLPKEVWNSQIHINQKAISFTEYMKGLMEHDLHHKRVVNKFLNECLEQ